MPRFALTEPSIGSTITRSGSARPEDALAELLRDEREVSSVRLEPGDDGVLGGGVDRGRVVAALPRAQHGLALGTGRKVVEDGLDVGDARPAEVEPVAHTGWKRRPEVSLGKK